MDIEDEPEYAVNSKEFEILKEKSFQASSNLFNEKMMFFGQKRIVDNITQFRFQPITFEQMASKTAELKRRNDDNLQPKTDATINSLTHLLRQLAEYEVEKAAYKNTNLKLKRAQGRLDHLKRIATVISADLLNAECMWIQMIYDFEKTQNRNKFDVMEMHRTESRACIRRIDLMKNALSKINITQNRDCILFQMNKLLLNELNMNDTIMPHQTTPFTMYEKLLKNNKENLQNIFISTLSNFALLQEM